MVKRFDRKKFWFGTEEKMQFIPVPNSGASMDPNAWTSSGTLLNGRGYGFHSFGSHKTYNFEWPSSSSRQDAQTMKSYFDGSYGRGLLYFLDPLTYDQNVLPAHWADPSIALGYDGPALVYGVTPTAVSTPPSSNQLPVRGASYDLSLVTAGFRGKDDAVFLPVPDGHVLSLGAFYTATGTGGVFVQGSGGVVRLPENDLDATNIVPSDFEGGVWLWVGKSSSGAATVTLHGLVGRVGKVIGGGGETIGYGEGGYGEGPYGGTETGTSSVRREGPWTGGMGHSGCRFSAPPTYAANTGVNGGQIGFAASFIEVGSSIAGG